MIGDGAFAELVARHRPRLLQRALRILGDRDDAADAAHDALLRARNGAAAVPGERLGAWLDRVVVNAAIDRLRRRGARPAALELDPAVAAPDAVRAEERRLLRAALEALPQQQRAVLRLRVIEQRTFAEIAAALAISDGATKTHFRRGVRALAARLRPTDAEDDHG